MGFVSTVYDSPAELILVADERKDTVSILIVK